MMDVDGKIANENINVCLVNYLPRGIHEQVIRNHDDSYTILIDAKQSWENQCKSYEHAVGHIINNDFDRTQNVQEIEMVAHFHSSAHIVIPSNKFEKLIRQRLNAIKRRRKLTAKKLRDYYETKKELLIED